jgi:peptidoglycan pentaglycine glycine transferase (the first glycine)
MPPLKYNNKKLELLDFALFCAIFKRQKDTQIIAFMEEKAIEKKNFLQSEEWRKFQEATGKRTFHVEHEGFSANIIEHTLPIVGKYFYIPRWPSARIMNHELRIKDFFDELVDLAKKEKAGWIRFDAESEEILDSIKKNINYKIIKAPHDMQPREIFVIDITKPEEQLLAEMKPKTRYNIKLSEKKGVFVKKITNHKAQNTNKTQNTNDKNSKYYIDKFVELINLTSKRKGISFHPGDYYRKMIATIDSDILSLYLAEYEGKIIAANLVIFFGKTATYLHGATDDEYRNVMAPYLLQWQAILDANKAGYEFYDFGGIKTYNAEHMAYNKNNWEGITKFKLGFSQVAKPIEFFGSYDIALNPFKYWLYKILQSIQSIF